MMHRIAFAALLGASSAALAQQRIPFAFDPNLAQNPSSAQSKTTALDRALPAWFHLPPAFGTLSSAPDGVSPPTTTLWLSPEVKSAFLRAASAGTTPMTWTGALCPQHRAFALPASSLLASGAPSSCASAETTVRQTLSAPVLQACEDVEQPEHYVLAYRLPPGTSQDAAKSAAGANTDTLEKLIGFAGAGLSTASVPEGLLPPDWVPTLRSILWKLRPTAAPARVIEGRRAFTQVLDVLTRDASCFDPAMRIDLENKVRALDTELAAAGDGVARLLSEAQAQAAQATQCLAIQGRTRPQLPYPLFTDQEREFIGFWLGGVYWRMRGGGLLQLGSTNSAREYFARRPFREIARIANGTQTGEKAADALFCNLQEGWGDWMDMGVTPGGQDMYEDLVQMTDRGRRQVGAWGTSALACGLLNGVSKSPEDYLRSAGFDTTDLYAGGLSMGPCYLYSLNPLKQFVYAPTSSATAPYSGFLEYFTELGEFCTGASLGLGLTRSLLKGTPSGQPATNGCGARRCGADACGNSCGTCASGLECLPDGSCGTGTVDPPDAGVSEPVDAGVNDPIDAGEDELVDAGVMVDAGASRPDAGEEPLQQAEPTGCECGTGGAGLALLGLVVRRRRSS